MVRGCSQQEMRKAHNYKVEQACRGEIKWLMAAVEGGGGRGGGAGSSGAGSGGSGSGVNGNAVQPEDVSARVNAALEREIARIREENGNGGGVTVSGE